MIKTRKGRRTVDGEETRKKTKEKKTKRQSKIISKKYTLFFSVQVFVFFFRFFFRVMEKKNEAKTLPTSFFDRNCHYENLFLEKKNGIPLDLQVCK